MVSDELTRLRAAVARTDEEICRAVGRRLDLARRVGQAKRRRSLPIRDVAVERGVARRWTRGLEEFGVRAESAETFARWLVEEAVRVQEAAPETVRASPRPRRRILVVGGEGSMGRWLVDFFAARGDRPEIYDPAAPVGSSNGVPVRRDFEAAVRDAQVVVVATPMRSAAAIYRRLWKSGTPALILDVLSVKAPLRAEIRRGRGLGFRVASLHPLFGPSARTLAGRNLLVLDCGDRVATRAAHDLFRGTPLTVTVLPIEAHDAWMADLQVLPRLVALLFARTLLAGPRTGAELRRGQTTSFHRQLQVVQEVLAENPELSWDLLSLNPHRSALEGRLARSLADLRRDLARSSDRQHRAIVRRSVARLRAPRPTAPKRGA